jgi:hypothetical protein
LGGFLLGKVSVVSTAAKKSSNDSIFGHLPGPSLQEIEIGVILSQEQIDVRRLLLADSPAAPTPERDPDFHQSRVTNHQSRFFP